MYQPNPIDTTDIELPKTVIALVEKLAENNHDIWALKRMAEEWTWGAERDDANKKHPDLISYDQLPDSEKQYDRDAAIAALKAIIALGFHIVPACSVVWLPRARSRIKRRPLIHQWDKELEHAFASESTAQITVGDVFGGYTVDETRKVVLGIQLSVSEAVGSHIVKLGDDRVKKDIDGWKQCILNYGVTSRVLMSVEVRELPQDRYAVIYQDAYRLFGTDPDTESPKPLEVAVDWAISGSKPDVRSAERVVVQIFSELTRCLYHGASDDSRGRAREFYEGELKTGGLQSAWERWKNQSFYDMLRRDAIWLTTARDRPDAEDLPGYLDPFDYFQWAIDAGYVPTTLIGRSHGDLHGRNILVGVHRGEIEQPAIFDYGDMAESNLPVWDFVKLEIELKTRILPKLYYEEEARKALAKAVPQVRPLVPPTAVRLSPVDEEVASRVDRMEFAFHFETLLASLTREIVSSDAAGNLRPSDQRQITGHPAIDKSLCFFYRLRQEAAYRLGYAIDRADRWRDEFYFALMTYGLLKAKWNIERPQLEWALVLAGVAAAQLSQSGEINKLRGQKRPHEKCPSAPLPSHLVPLAWAHALWKEKRSGKACQLLEEALVQFPSAVTLKAEYALCLAASGDRESATEQVSHLQPLCCVFRDYEMLCRLGRVFKDLADKDWESDSSQPDYRSFVESRHPAWQLYKEAFGIYLEAYEFSRHYFPGINAATLALLTGRNDAQMRIAKEVSRICCEARIANAEERFWIYATEGEASLLGGDETQPLRFYCSALSTPCATKLGMVQAMYDQLCRLDWALGRGAVQPIIDELRKREILKELAPGPLGDCGLNRRPRNAGE